MKIDLQQLTKQKFERMGYSFYNKKHNGVNTSYFSCQKSIPHDFGTEIYINEAQLITLDSEIQEEEARIDELSHVEFTPNVSARLVVCEARLTELKKMRKELLT